MRNLSLTLMSLLLTIAVEAQSQGTAYESKVVYSNILKMDRKFSIYLPAGYESLTVLILLYIFCILLVLPIPFLTINHGYTMEN